MQPIQVLSLKAACVQRLEALILSGEWQIGMRLPSERDLAAQLSISRPVLHDALVELAAKGLVSIEPRRGVFINDYRVSGSCALLSSLLEYNGGNLDPAFTRSLIDMRLLVETETAALAAQHRTDEHLAQLNELLSQEEVAMQEEAAKQDEHGQSTGAMTALDFAFHLRIAIASGNLVYPLILNSFQSVYTHLTGRFFQHFAGTPVLDAVSEYHRRLVDAIAGQQQLQARAVMEAMLKHGAEHLQQIP